LNLVSGRVFYGWWIVVLGSLIQVVGGGILYQSFTVFFLPLKRDFGVSSAAISLLYGAARLEGGFEGPVVGYLIDRLGARIIIIIGASMAGVGLILLATVHSYLSFFLIYIFIVSLGYNAGFFHPASAAVTKWFIRHRGLGLSILGASMCVGGMIMAPLLSHIILSFGWRTGAVISGLIILIVALPAALPIHRSPEVLGLSPDGRPPREDHPENPQKERHHVADVDFTVREALGTVNYWLLMAGITLRLLVTVALNTHFIPILVWKGMNEATAAYLVSLFALCTIFTTLLIGWMGDRMSKPLLCSAGILPMILTLAGLIFSKESAILYSLPIGLSIIMGTMPLNWAIIGDFFGRRSYATLRGIMGIFYGVATFVSPIYAGWIFDLTGSYTIVLLTFAIVLAIAAAIFFAWLRPPAPKRPFF